ncbi:MAG: hypothetical protein HC913_18785, partial [Microscillaceae bacterium]|nr:hypothetical protein [Microscillaceae bacterium]
ADEQAMLKAQAEQKVEEERKRAEVAEEELRKLKAQMAALGSNNENS